MFRTRKSFLILLALISTFQITNAQDKSQKKKGSFWKVMGDLTGTSELFAGEKIVRGEWGTYGSGAGWNMGTGFDRRFSPRNFSYTFDVTENNAAVRFLWESDTDIGAIVVSETGQIYDFYMVGDPIQNHKYQRAGKYRLIVFTNNRGSLGKFIFRVQGPVSNFTSIQSQRWETPGTDFGTEGAGGAYDNAFSPRNHRYTFTPALGKWFDVNVESNGVPVKVYIVDPNGKVFSGSDNGPGISYHVLKAETKGLYQVYVCSEKPNDIGTYKLDIMGDFQEEPKQVKSNFQRVAGVFNPGSLKHEYEITVNANGYLETIYRSSTVEASMSLRDSFGKSLPWHSNNSTTPRYLNLTAQARQSTNPVLEISGTSPGGYELLVWGDFDAIKSREIKIEQSEDPRKTGGNPLLTTSRANAAKVSGRITSYTRLPDYHLIKVLIEDLESGKYIGEIQPDRHGEYVLYLPLGGQYSITATVDANRIASSHFVDLSKAADASKQISVEPISVISNTDVGSKLVLNNIFFDTGSAILLRKSYAELRRIAAFLKANPGVKVEIAGHTDSVGDDASNRTLSQNRANAVLYYLQDQTGDSGARLQAKGYGRNEPIASNNTEAGRQQNRRVEFLIVR